MIFIWLSICLLGVKNKSNFPYFISPIDDYCTVFLTGSYFIAVEHSRSTGSSRVLERNSMNVSHPIKTFETEDT